MSVRISPTQNWTGSDVSDAVAASVYAQAGVTTADLTLYVATTGSDVTGNGTALLPYATVVRAMQDVPRVVAHKVKILITAGTYASGWPTHIDPVFIDAGSLALIGVGAPTVVSGPHTVTGVADLGTAGQRITCAAAHFGAVDSRCGETIIIATGGHVAQAHQVVANTDTTIDLILHSDKVHNADTFNVVRPAVKVEADGFTVEYNSSGVPDGSTPYVPKNCRIVFHNIFFDMSASPSVFGLFNVSGRQGRSGPTFDFVRVDLPATTYAGAIFENTTSAWLDRPYSSDYVVDGGTGIVNLDSYEPPGLTISGSGDRDVEAVYTWGECQLYNLVVKGMVIEYQGSLELATAGVGMLMLYGSGKSYPHQVLVVGKVAAVAIEQQSPSAYIADVHICIGTYAINQHDTCKTTLYRVSCDAVAVATAMSVFALGGVRQKGALTTFVGASVGGNKAYVFQADTGVKSDTWHAANLATVTDAKGAHITRLD